MKRKQAKHKLCRRLGSCVWGDAKCPSAKRPYPAGSSKYARRQKLSTYGELLQEKQKLRAHYDVNEKQLRFTYHKAQTGKGSTPEKLLSLLELRLVSVVFRSGLAPSIFAAKQLVNHRHVQVDGRTVDRNGFQVKPGQVVSLNTEKSASVVAIAQNTEVTPPPYLEVDKTNCKVTVARLPHYDEIPANVEAMRVVEYYAR